MNDRSSYSWKLGRETRSMRDIDDWSGNEPKRPSSSTWGRVRDATNSLDLFNEEKRTRIERMKGGEKKNRWKGEGILFGGINVLRPRDDIRSRRIISRQDRGLNLGQVCNEKTRKFSLFLFPILCSIISSSLLRSEYVSSFLSSKERFPVDRADR